MLDFNYIKDNREAIKRAIEQKHIDLDLDKLIELGDEVRKTQRELDSLRRIRKLESEVFRLDLEIDKILKSIPLDLIS